MLRPGLPELLIILLIVLVVFGAGRIRRVFGEMGSGIAEFRKGLREGQEEQPVAKSEVKEDEPLIRS